MLIGTLLKRPTLLALVAFLLFASFGRAAEVIPPAPRDHFNDYAGLVRPDTAAQLERELAQFERDTSSQILVVIYPRMQSDSSIDDYTVRVFEAWNPGQKRQSNGAVLFIFSEQRRMRIATGYGLEGALPDALCKRILDDEIAPRFRAGDYSAGVAAGVHAMMAAARGEYRGTGRTNTEAGANGSGLGAGTIFVIVAFVILFTLARRSSQRGVVYGRRGRRAIWVGPPWGGWGSGGDWGGGGSWGGGGGGGGSFSGGGGHTGGGGASGSW
jgi:uncharacterized protein